jgi:hypothetical protein
MLLPRLVIVSRCKEGNIADINGPPLQLDTAVAQMSREKQKKQACRVRIR